MTPTANAMSAATQARYVDVPSGASPQHLASLIAAAIEDANA